MPAGGAPRPAPGRVARLHGRDGRGDRLPQRAPAPLGRRHARRRPAPRHQAPERLPGRRLDPAGGLRPGQGGGGRERGPFRLHDAPLCGARADRGEDQPPERPVFPGRHLRAAPDRAAPLPGPGRRSAAAPLARRAGPLGPARRGVRHRRPGPGQAPGGSLAELSCLRQGPRAGGPRSGEPGQPGGPRQAGRKPAGRSDLEPEGAGDPARRHDGADPGGNGPPGGRGKRLEGREGTIATSPEPHCPARRRPGDGRDPRRPRRPGGPSTLAVTLGSNQVRVGAG